MGKLGSKNSNTSKWVASEHSSAPGYLNDEEFKKAKALINDALTSGFYNDIPVLNDVGVVNSTPSFSNETILPSNNGFNDNWMNVTKEQNSLIPYLETPEMIKEDDNKVKQSQNKIRQLQTTTGDAMLDDVLGEQGIRDLNQGLINVEQKKIDKVKGQTLYKKGDDLNALADKWLQNDYKMTDSEVDQAKKLISEWENTSRNINAVDNVSEEEKLEHQRMTALKDKVYARESAIYGVENAIPGVDAMLQKADDNYYGWTLDDLKYEAEHSGKPISEEVQKAAEQINQQIATLNSRLNQTNNSTGDAMVDEAEGLTGMTPLQVAETKKQIEELEKQKYKMILGDSEDPYGYKSRKENAQTQNRGAYMAGDMVTRAVETAISQKALGSTQYGQYLDDLFGAENGNVGKFFSETFKDAPVDLLTDTLPEYLSNKASGMDESDVNKALFTNILVNLGINAGIAGVSTISDFKKAIHKNIENKISSGEMSGVQGATTENALVEIARRDPNILKAEKEDISNQLYDLAKGEMPSGEYVRLGETPSYLSEYGDTSNPLVMKQDTVNKVAYPEGYLKGKHNLGYDSITNLPEQLDNPVGILDSNTQPNSAVVLTNMIDDQNNPVTVPIHMDKDSGIGKINEVASMQGRRNTDALVENSNARYIDKKESIRPYPARDCNCPS